MFLFDPADDKGGAVATDDKGLAEFNKRFSPDRFKGALPTATDPKVDPKPEPKTEPEPKPDDHTEPVDAKKPFVKQQIERARAAEKERDEIKQRLETFEKAEKPALEKKIAELESQLKGASAGDQAALQKRIEEAEQRLQQRETELTGELEKTRKRLSFYNVQEDPEFQAKFVQPIKESYAGVVETLGGDQSKIDQLRKALIANSAALSATKPEERIAAEKERNSILSVIRESLDEFTGGQFFATVSDYIRHTRNHAQAIANHEQTAEEVRRESADRMASQRAAVLGKFQELYKTTEPGFAEDTSLNAEEAAELKKLGVDVGAELDQANTLTSRALAAKTSVEEGVKLMHQGRVYPVLRAKLRAKDSIIAGLQATIKKLEGAGTGGGAATTQTESEKETREEFHRRFSASRFAGSPPVKKD